MAVNRIVYATTGVLVLYFAVVPVLSSFPGSRPAWMTALLGISVACLFLAAMFPATRLRIAAALGSGLVLAMFVGYPIAERFAERLGYMHKIYKLVTFHERWIDRLRVTLDRPFWVLLLVFALASFFLSVRSRAIDHNSAE